MWLTNTCRIEELLQDKKGHIVGERGVGKRYDSHCNTSTAYMKQLQMHQQLPQMQAEFDQQHRQDETDWTVQDQRQQHCDDAC